MSAEDLTQLLLRLASLPYETEWVEFKRDNADPAEIGEYLAESSIPAAEALSLLDYAAYFDLTGQRLPEDRDGVLQKLESERFILSAGDGRFDVTNLGAVLLAKDLHTFENLRRKAVRVIVYGGANRVETVREQLGRKGYAAGFTGPGSTLGMSRFGLELM